MEKNVLIAYLLWLLGGWLGLHHFYLGRDRHAFTWWCTLGGVFGLGWFRDLWRIPDYVDDANQDHDYLEDLKRVVRRSPTPPFSMVRFLGSLFLGLSFGYLVMAIVPTTWYEGTRYWYISYIMLTVVPFFVGLGVHTVANIGRERVSFQSALRGSYMSLPLLLLGSSNITYTGLSCSIYVNNAKSWDLSPPKHHNICRRVLVVTICCCLYTSLWLLALSHNAYVTTRDGEQILVREAIKNFFTSPAWAETKKTFGDLFEALRRHGWRQAWDEFNIKLDPEGETNAYRVLGLSSSANESDISSAYRKLARLHHPDKVRDPELKEEAEEKFMQIQKAYETLSSIKSRRAKKNKRTVKPEDKTEL